MWWSTFVCYDRNCIPIIGNGLSIWKKYTCDMDYQYFKINFKELGPSGGELLGLIPSDQIRHCLVIF